MNKHGLLKESNFICQSILYDLLATIPKSKLFIKILSKSDFKVIIKPISVILQREIIEEEIIDPIPPEIKQMETLFQEEISGFTIVPVQSKPLLDVSHSPDSNIIIGSTPVKKEPLSTQSFHVQAITTEDINRVASPKASEEAKIFAHIDHKTNFPVIELIEELNLAEKTSKTIITVFKEFSLFHKIQNELIFQERRSQKVLGGIHFQEEDVSVKRKPPVIILEKKCNFQVFYKPNPDYFYYKKEFSENSQQTEKTTEKVTKLDLKPVINAVTDFKPEITSPQKDNNLQTAAKIISLGFIDPGLKKNEIESIKKEAKERELARKKRRDSAVKIQAWVRGV